MMSNERIEMIIFALWWISAFVLAFSAWERITQKCKRKKQKNPIKVKVKIRKKNYE